VVTRIPVKELWEIAAYSLVIQESNDWWSYPSYGMGIGLFVGDLDHMAANDGAGVKAAADMVKTMLLQEGHWLSEILESHYPNPETENHMNPIKKLTAAVALLILCSGAAMAQVANVNALPTAVFSVPASGTSNYTTANISVPFSVERRDQIGMQAQFKLSGAGTENMTFVFVRSADGVTYETSPKITWTIAGTGATAVCAYTNIPTTLIGSAKYLRLESIANGNATYYLTNIQVVAALKRTLP
jgi:hypothetical protein